MPIFKNLNELKNFLEKQVMNNLSKIGEEVKGVLRNFILNDLYKTYSPREYERTEQFLNAVEVKPVKKNGNVFQVEIFINPDLMEHDTNLEGHSWLHHTSSLGDYRGDTEYNGKDIAWWLIYWFETGDNSSPFSRGRIGMIESTVDWIKQEDYLRVRLKELFLKNGIPSI